MKKIHLAKSASLLLVVVIALASAVFSSDKHIKVTLDPISGSTVTGFVQLTQLPKGGTNLHVTATGLQPGTVYASFYYESSDCSAPADLLGTFTADDTGNGEVSGKIDDDLDEVGSVSVRIGPDYGTLLACAKVH
jgi:hypothetical protein